MQDVLEGWRPVIDEAMEEHLPRTVDEEYPTTFYGPPSYSYQPDAIQLALADLV